MFKLFCPDLFIEKVEQIDLEKLRFKGFDTLIFDLDNTLVGWKTREFSPQVIQWLKEASKLDFKMCIVSNCLIKRRVSSLSELLGIPAISKATKPRKRAFVKALELLESKPRESVIIGDQIFTDILGGNRLGAYTILVSPVDKCEFFTTFFQRLAEKVLLYSFKRKGRLKTQNDNSTTSD